ncbi:MAG TPA: histidine phosphatase family protein [Patescibacteria group bacterium]
MGLLEHKPKSRLIFVRHLETPIIQQRYILKKDPKYVRFLHLINTATPQTLPNFVPEIKALGEDILGRYEMMPKDNVLPIAGGQEAWGMAIGNAIEDRYRIDEIEESTHLRARQTRELLQRGSSQLAELTVAQNPDLIERTFGDADIFPFGRLYLSTNMEELGKFVADRDNYTYPNSEIKPVFNARMQRQANRFETKADYAGKTTLVVGHSTVTKHQVAILTRPTLIERALGRKNPYSDLSVDTGSITVLEEKRKLNPLSRRRRYRVIAANERLVPMPTL